MADSLQFFAVQARALYAARVNGLFHGLFLRRYRGSPALEPLTDAERIEFLRCVENLAFRRWWSVLLLCGAMILTSVLFVPIFDRIDRLPLFHRNDTLTNGLILVVLLGPALVPTLWLIRAIVRAEFRSVVAQSPRHSGCVRCRYDLSGLAGERGRLTCPECGLAMPDFERSTAIRGPLKPS